MKITIIGAGNIGGATALGISSSNLLKPSDITVTARHESTLDRFRKLGINALTDNKEAVKNSDAVIIAVKPWVVQSVIEEIKNCLDYSRQLIISMAAGVAAEDMLVWLSKSEGPAPELLYVIPNTAIELGQSMTFISAVSCSELSVSVVEKLFDSVGKTLVVPVSKLSAGTSLASCGIAYAFRYIHASAQGGVELGLYPEEAVKTVCQTLKGAAALLEAHGSHPEAEIDKVTTPGGLTIRGLNAMEDAGFSAAVVHGLKASK